MLNLNCNSGCVSKDREGFLVGFSAVTALSVFVLKKRFKCTDMLVSDDDRTDMIEYKSLGVRYKVEFPQISLESLADISVVRVNF